MTLTWIVFSQFGFLKFFTQTKNRAGTEFYSHFTSSVLKLDRNSIYWFWPQILFLVSIKGRGRWGYLLLRFFLREGRGERRVTFCIQTLAIDPLKTLRRLTPSNELFIHQYDRKSIPVNTFSSFFKNFVVVFQTEENTHHIRFFCLPFRCAMPSKWSRPTRRIVKVSEAWSAPGVLIMII